MKGIKVNHYKGIKTTVEAKGFEVEVQFIDAIETLRNRLYFVDIKGELTPVEHVVLLELEEHEKGQPFYHTILTKYNFYRHLIELNENKKGPADSE